MNRTQYGVAIIVKEYIPLPSTGCVCVTVSSLREILDAAFLLASYPILVANLVVSLRCTFVCLQKGIKVMDMGGEVPENG
jgi:hypothetical protein